MAHNDTHVARKKGGAGKILLVVLLLLLLAAGATVLFARSEIRGSGKPGTEVTSSALPTCSAGMWGKRVLPQSCNTAILS